MTVKLEIQRDGRPVEVEALFREDAHGLFLYDATLTGAGYWPVELTAEEKAFCLNLALAQLERKP